MFFAVLTMLNFSLFLLVELFSWYGSVGPSYLQYLLAQLLDFISWASKLDSFFLSRIALPIYKQCMSWFPGLWNNDML